MSKRKTADQAATGTDTESELDEVDTQPTAASEAPNTSAQQPVAAAEAGQQDIHPPIEPLQVRVGGRPDRSVRLDGPTITKKVEAHKDDPLPGSE